MIISENWLREWISVELDAETIADRLTRAGLEVESLEPAAQPIENLVVGRVLEVGAHPNADRLSVVSVDVGDDQPLEIVCGAPNVQQGMLSPVALVGATLPGGLEIKQSEVRGVVSAGMLCSAAELGLSEDASGLLQLDAGAEPGQSIGQLLGFDDQLIDIDMTPNRGDCLSVQGVARELNVLTAGQYHPPEIQSQDAAIADGIDLMLEDQDGCPRYLGRVISGIDANATTPLWLQERLRRCGERSISPVVDITNYVMLELGQPMHAFDRERIDDKIVVRQSMQGEQITLLDDSEVSLDGDTLIIADANKPIALAGVMGGKFSAIDASTTTIVLEAAHFTRKAVAGRARRYGLHTESAFRFERGVDPQLPAKAMERATQLVLQICGGNAGPVCEANHRDGIAARPDVTVRLERLRNLLGMPLEASEVGEILERVCEQVESGDEEWVVTPPSYRFDMQYEADLVEEVARVKGYDEVPTAIPRIAPRATAASEASVDLRRVRQTLVARDFHEIISYSFIDPGAQKKFCREQAIRLANPLAENLSVMRTSLLPGLLAALEFNANRQRERIRLFEIGASYHGEEGQISERLRLAGLVCGPRFPQQWDNANSASVDFYDLKADLTAVLALTGRKEPFIFKEFEHIALQPGQVSQISLAGQNGDQNSLGWLGRLHPALQKESGSSHPVYVFEIDVEKALTAEVPLYSQISRFPGVKRDLSVVVEQSVAAGDLLGAVRSELGSALSQVVIFDVYQGERVGQDQKSVSFALSLQDPEKTLTDAESEQMIDAVLARLAKDFGAALRSE